MEKGRPQPGRPFPVPSERGLETETDADDASVAAANAVFILAALIFSRDVSVASHSKFQAATIANAFERSTRVAVRRFKAGIGIANLAEGQHLRLADIAKTHRSGEKGRKRDERGGRG